MSWLVEGDGALCVVCAGGTEQDSGSLLQLTDNRFTDEYPAWGP
jgi:hypothetical protein